MSRSRLGAGLASLVLALGAAGPLAGCGGDEEGEDLEPTTTAEPAEDPAIVPEDPGPAPAEEPDTDTGGTYTPVVPDDGHEGGGPDPGTEEAERAEGNGTGGVSGDAGSGGQSGDGPAPPDAFDRFCEEKPRACE